jgi:uncharacterized protein
MKFLPQVLPISSFGDGGFRFGGHSHLGSLLVLPSGMRAWDVGAILSPANFVSLAFEKDKIDFVLLGTGPEMFRPPPTVLKYFAESHMNLDFMSTSSAVHTYNVMLAEGRRLAACLIAVDKAVP